MIVAIDGPAGSGKSTIARLVAEGLGFVYINSGNIYRAITLGAIRRGLALANTESMISYAKQASIEYRQRRLFLDGLDVESLLHGTEVDASVAQVSAIPEIRGIVNAHVRRLAGLFGCGCRRKGHDDCRISRR